MLEEIAGTAPSAFFVAGRIGTAIAAKVDRKLDELDAVRFLSIAVGFFNLPDET